MVDSVFSTAFSARFALRTPFRGCGTEHTRTARPQPLTHSAPLRTEPSHSGYHSRRPRTPGAPRRELNEISQPPLVSVTAQNHTQWAASGRAHLRERNVLVLLPLPYPTGGLSLLRRRTRPPPETNHAARLRRSQRPRCNIASLIHSRPQSIDSEQLSPWLARTSSSSRLTHQRAAETSSTTDARYHRPAWKACCNRQTSARPGPKQTRTSGRPQSSCAAAENEALRRPATPRIN